MKAHWLVRFRKRAAPAWWRSLWADVASELGPTLELGRFPGLRFRPRRYTDIEVAALFAYASRLPGWPDVAPYPIEIEPLRPVPPDETAADFCHAWREHDRRWAAPYDRRWTAL